MSREIDAIVRAYRTAHNGIEKINLAKKGYLLADRENDTDSSLWFRFEYIQQNCFYGDMLQVYLMFPEILKIYDEYVKLCPHTSYTRTLIWDYKWILQNARYYYQISTRQFNAFVMDYKRRLIENGYSLRSLHLYMALFYSFISPDKAAQYFDAHLHEKRDSRSDCVACERCNEMEYLVAANRFEEALELGQPIFEGRMTCTEEPYDACGVVLCECCNRFLAGDTAALDACGEHAENIKQGLRKGVLPYRAANVILYHTLLGETSKALPYYKKYSLILSRVHNPGEIFEFDLAAARFFQTVGRPAYRFKLVPEHPLYRESGVYSCDELRDHYLSEAVAIAQKLDARNDTDLYKKRVELTMNGARPD